MTVNITYLLVSSGSGSGNRNNPMAGNQTDDFVTLRIPGNITWINLPDSLLALPMMLVLLLRMYLEMEQPVIRNLVSKLMDE